MKYINFSQLRSFHAVAKTESITLASKLLNISQPTITKQIQLLEEFYTINVINRHARGITLTDLGKKLNENHNDVKLVFAGYSELYLGNLTLWSIWANNSKNFLKVEFFKSVIQFKIFENKTPIFPFLSI